jgi:hypothetical protein
MRAALSKPSLTIVDDSPGDGGASPWGAAAGQRSGTSTRSASPEVGGAGGIAAGRKKKKQGKVLLMSHGVLRG